MQARITEGGRYILKDGKLERVEDPTKPHQDGDAPRDAQGRRLDRPADTNTILVAEPSLGEGADTAASSQGQDATLTTPKKKGARDAS